MSDVGMSLSEREMEILRLVATGATNQQIARELVISVNTVKVHLRNIYAKLEVSSRTEATMVAVREGWMDVPRSFDGIEREEPTEEQQGGGSPLLLPFVEQWPPIPMAKRLALVVAILLAAVILFLPEALGSGANDGILDPIGGVFPTVPADPSGSRWRTRAQMPTPRTNLAVAAYEGLIYAIGGVSNDGATGRVEIYDPRANAWMSGRSKPTSVGFVSAVVLGDKIFVPGGIGAGQDPQAILEIYDPAKDSWQLGAPMPEPLGAYGLAGLDGQLYLFGGWNGQDYVASVYRYDPAADRWDSLRPMEQARGFLGAAPVGDRIYVVGGYDGVTEFRSCESFDPSADTWTMRSPMDLRRGGLALIAVRESLYAIGGGMNGYMAFNERYDPRIDVWSRIETPVVGQWQGLGSAFVGQYVYAMGGWNGAALSANEAYQALFEVSLP